MSLSSLLTPALWGLALIGVAALALVAALATPLTAPPPLMSIQTGALAVGSEGRPELSRFQARDGSWLAYRRYPGAEGDDRLVILAHGSSASSDSMHALARAIAASGAEAIAIDARGHGASGTRGDIAYIGQLDDDLADLVAQLRRTKPAAKLTLLGHSAGAGFVMRIAGGPLGREFERFVLLAPYLGYRAPTNRPNEGSGRWASVDMPRVLALTLMDSFGLDGAGSLPVLAFAHTPEALPFVTRAYSFRLMTNYTSPPDWTAPFAAARGKVTVIAGLDDELMNAPVYKTALEPLGASVTLLPGVDHMGVCYRPAALAAVVEAVK